MAKPKTAPEASAVTDTLRRASALHQRGQLDDAEGLYRQTLTHQPRNFDALHLLGVLMHQRGKSSEALDLIGEALKTDARSTAALSNRAIVLAALGKNDAALASYDQAIALKPDYAEALNGRGNLLVKLGRTEDALKNYEQTLAIDARNLDALTNSAIVLRLLGRDADAAGAYMRALAVNPNRAEVWTALGNTFGLLHQHEDALMAFDRALALTPRSAEILSNRGNTLWQLRRVGEALTSFDAALALKPDAVEIHNNRGNALLDLNRPDDALASFDRALTLKPDYTEALVNRANALRDLNRSHDAIASCDAALAINPELAEAHWNKGLEQLLLGDFDSGWAEYEWRWKRAGISSTTLAPCDFGVPQWRGENIGGKTILLHAEQGFGDTIQFVRYVPLVAARGGKIVLEVPDSLRPLLGKLDGVIAIIARGEPHPAIDLHCPMMSLPLAFGTTLSTIPASVPYLRAPAERVEAWRARLPASGKRVGLVWSGKPSHRNDHNRSIALERLAPLLARTDVEFVSLQREVRETDRAALERSAMLRPDLDAADFADTAAIVGSLDLVIAVDTAVAHLAGAMNKPLWLLLPFSPDWRWMLGRNDSPWYPSARLFRQPRIGAWDAVIHAVNEALASLAATRDTPAT